MNDLYRLLNATDMDVEEVRQLFVSKAGKVRLKLVFETLSEVYEQVSEQGLGEVLIENEEIFWENFNTLVVELGVYQQFVRSREYHLGASGTLAIGQWVWKLLKIEPGTKIVAFADPFKKEVVLKPEK